MKKKYSPMHISLICGQVYCFAVALIMCSSLFHKKLLMASYTCRNKSNMKYVHI